MTNAEITTQKAQRELAISVLNEELKKLEVQAKGLDVQIKQIDLAQKTGGLVPLQQHQEMV